MLRKCFHLRDNSNRLVWLLKCFSTSRLCQQKVRPVFSPMKRWSPFVLAGAGTLRGGEHPDARRVRLRAGTDIKFWQLCGRHP